MIVQKSQKLCLPLVHENESRAYTCHLASAQDAFLDFICNLTSSLAVVHLQNCHKILLWGMARCASTDMKVMMK